MRKLALILALALLLAACGGSGDDDAATATTTTTTTVADQSNDQMADDTMTDDQMTDDNMTDDTMTDDTMADDTMTDDNMADDTMTDDNMTDDTMADDTMSHDAVTFTVTITNHSDSAGLATPLSPGAYIISTSMDTLFTEGGVDRGEGLESLAEDGDPTALISDLSAMSNVPASGVFNTPDGADTAGPALPNDSYSFTFEATPGDYLSFATMFVQSNDWFFAPASSGINLFPDDTAISGDITQMVSLWDAGTEVDEAPGEGPNQGARQTGPNTGDAQGAPITTVDGYDGAITVTIATS